LLQHATDTRLASISIAAYGAAHFILSAQRNTLTERATAATPPTRDRKQNNCMPAETRPPRSVPSPPPKRRRDMPRADRGRQQLLDDLGYVQPIFRAGNSGDCTILKSVAVLLVVIGLVVFVGRFAE